MSGQYALTVNQEKEILKILKELNIDYEDNEVSIHVSSYKEDYEREEEEEDEEIQIDYKVNIYVQVS